MNLPEFFYTVLLKPKPLKICANWVLKKITPPTIKVSGATIHLNPDDPVVSGALTLNVFEKDEIAFFIRHFKSDMTLLDVGSNVGLYSGLALSREKFNGKVICMEPHKESMSYLEKTLSSNNQSNTDGNIIVSSKAASNFQGKTMLYTNPDNKGDSRLYRDPLLSGQQEIAVTTIDLLCKENGIDKIDFIKIDVQGAEEQAIVGATSTLGNSEDCIILSELWPYGLTQCGSSVRSYISTLDKLGFQIFKLEKNGVLAHFDIDVIESKFVGRQYTNIVGFKGKYLPSKIP
ncbi:MAG TPA: FkbM family methyltransferase [Pseudomonadales bacterium]